MRKFTGIMAGMIGLGMVIAPQAVERSQTETRAEVSQASASQVTQERNTNGRVLYTPMSQAERDAMPNIRLSTGSAINRGPGTRQRRRRRDERRTRGGGK
jgi:hypothetical protein